MFEEEGENGYVKKRTNRSKRLQADNPQVTVSNNADFSYYGPVYMGTDQVEVQLVYDTASDWLVVESSTCSNC